MEQVLDRQSMKALGADSRQHIIKLLANRPYTASELSRLLKKHVTTIAEHLSTLESSGLIEKKEDGHKWIYYKLTPKGERLTKPMFNSWKIMLALAALSFVGGIYDFTSSVSYLQKEGLPQDMQAVAGTIQAQQPEIWPLLIILAAILMVVALVLRRK
ncbi:MAG TPA: helix-turn-helix domain-containing protein [archaeon]|nr:helix-turn-helix domain-containing protein [archaeon]